MFCRGETNNNYNLIQRTNFGVNSKFSLNNFSYAINNSFIYAINNNGGSKEKNHKINDKKKLIIKKTNDKKTNNKKTK